MRAKLHPIAVAVACTNCDASQVNPLDGSHIWNDKAIQAQQDKAWTCLDCGERLTINPPKWARI